MFIPAKIAIGLLVSMGLASALRADDKPKPKFIDYEAELNDKLGKGIIPEKNACVLLWKAFGPIAGEKRMPADYFKRLGSPEPPAKGDYFVTTRQLVNDELKLDLRESNDFFNQQERASSRPWAAKNYPDIARLLTKNEKPLAAIIEATRRPQYYNPLVPHKSGKEPGLLIGALLPSVVKSREAATALCARAMLRLHEGKPDAAWADLLACHRLGRLIAQGGTPLEGLVGYAIEAAASNAELAYIEHAKLTSRQIRDRLNDLQKLPPMPMMAAKFGLGMRYTYLDALNAVRRGNLGDLEELGKDVPLENIRDAWATLDWEPAIKDANAWFDRIEAAARLPTRAARVVEFEKLEKGLKKLRKDAADNTGIVARELNAGDINKIIVKKIGDILLGLLLPAYPKAQDYNDRTLQIHANLRVAFALAAYRADNRHYPAKLDELAPKYIAAIPIDLFSNRPLIYRPMDEGYLLYSIGVNGKDDEGRGKEDAPPGDDLRVRMPLPPLRKK